MEFIRYKLTHSQTATPRDHQKLITITTSTVKDRGNGTTRSVQRDSIIYVPTSYSDASNSASAAAVPLVIVLHGATGTANYCVHEMKWSEKADAEHFMVVYPNGSRPYPSKPPGMATNAQTWNDGSGRFESEVSGVDDVSFIRQLIWQLQNGYRIDEKRIYVTGMSNGASMAMRCGLELSDMIAAIAPCAGALWTTKMMTGGDNNNRKNASVRGISVLYVTGYNDTMNPLNGGYPKMLVSTEKMRNSSPKPPVSQTIAALVKILGASSTGSSKWSALGNAIRHAEVYRNEQDGAEVVFLVLENHGHHWPGGNSVLPKLLMGPKNTSFQGTDVMWDFFESHPMP
mmetsp:Transcript_23024/g.26481  ORF Transcript_23024/g.26481 Transcript_23024/m.26481 type:complete len:343 (-) Transcript_23024:40-1068(-)